MPAPLASLEPEGNKYGLQQYSFPLDVGNNPKYNHVVQFAMYDPKSISYQETPQGDNGGGEGGTSSGFDLSTVIGNISSFANEAITKLGNSFDLQSGYKAKSAYTEAKGTITLYMPDSLDFSSSAEYNTASIGDLVASVADKIISKIPGNDKNKGGLAGIISDLAKGGGPATQIALDTAGYAINPQQQLLFQGIDFRSFGMAFVFTPKSSDESDAIKNIIRAFKRAAAPTLVEDTAGFLYKPPSIFDITFYSGGSKNDYLYKLGRSVLRNIQVNYAPNGWSAYETGAPVQVTLGLEFQEVELMHRAKLDELEQN
jgi:hypothetical protein